MFIVLEKKKNVLGGIREVLLLTVLATQTKRVLCCLRGVLNWPQTIFIGHGMMRSVLIIVRSFVKCVRCGVVLAGICNTC